VKWCLSDEAENNLWKIGREIVPVLLLNGERLLDLPRPLPLGIGYLGELGAGSPLSDEKAKELPTIPEPFSSIYDGKSGGIGVALFSLGTVSNQTNMPFEHVLAFVDAFARVPELEFFWKTEQTDLVEELVAQRSQAKNIHPMRWMPQKLLLSECGFVIFLIFLNFVIFFYFQL
jgi:hypothetical protein